MIKYIKRFLLKLLMSSGIFFACLLMLLIVSPDDWVYNMENPILAIYLSILITVGFLFGAVQGFGLTVQSIQEVNDESKK